MAEGAPPPAKSVWNTFYLTLSTEQYVLRCFKCGDGGNRHHYVFFSIYDSHLDRFVCLYALAPARVEKSWNANDDGGDYDGDDGDNSDALFHLAMCFGCFGIAMMTEMFLRACTHLYAFSRAIWDGRKLEKWPECTSNVEAHHKISKMKTDERKMATEKHRQQQQHHLRFNVSMVWFGREREKMGERGGGEREREGGSGRKEKAT